MRFWTACAGWNSVGDGEPVYQFAQQARHAEVAHAMLEAGHAYRCYCSPDELTAMREKAKAEKRPIRYDGTWRDRDPSQAPAGVDPVIRLKAPQDGETVIDDLVQGPRHRPERRTGRHGVAARRRHADLYAEASW